MQLTINFPDTFTEDDVVSGLQWIATQVSEGYTSGHVSRDEHWEYTEGRPAPEFVYTPTHWSINDGSHAMAVDLGPGLYLANENGDEWEADPMEWRTAEQMRDCVHCQRWVADLGGVWIDPFALDDDAVWRETCDSNDTFEAPHEVA